MFNVEQMTADRQLEAFVKRFLLGHFAWWNIPRQDAIINFGNIIRLLLYRKEQYQVELFIVPFAQSSFTLHCHPDVDSYEFPLTGDNMLFLDGQYVFTAEQVQQWLASAVRSTPVHIGPDCWHSGYGNTPYAFLSMQRWLHGIEPTSVGLNWQGVPSSLEHANMLSAQQV
jgi:hypothetical protein